MVLSRARRLTLHSIGRCRILRVVPEFVCRCLPQVATGYDGCWHFFIDGHVRWLVVAGGLVGADAYRCAAEGVLGDWVKDPISVCVVTSVVAAMFDLPGGIAGLLSHPSRIDLFDSAPREENLDLV
jgi:hypothetical protein